MAAGFTTSACGARLDLLRRWVGPLSALAALLVFNAPLAAAQRESDLAIHRAGLERWTAMPEGFWGKTRLPDAKPH